MSTSRTYIVEGMTCDHCVRSIRDEVSRVPGVTDIDVRLAGGALTVASTDPLDDGAVRDAVEEAGYRLAGR